MLAQRGPVGIQPAEIDHVADSCRSRRTNKTLRVRAVASGEPSAAAHGVDQVEDGVNPDERSRIRSLVIEVEAPIFDALQPIERLGVTAKATDDVAGFYEAWDKCASDKARGAGDGDGSGSIARCLRIRHPGGTALIRRIGCSGGISRSAVSVGNSVICRVVAPRTLIPRKVNHRLRLAYPGHLVQSPSSKVPFGDHWLAPSKGSRGCAQLTAQFGGHGTALQMSAETAD